MVDACIAIVTYQSSEVIGECLDSCISTGAEIIVVDNASSDGTVNEVRERQGVRLIANPENRGFAGGVNQAFAATRKSCVLLLNPDAKLQSGFDQLVEAAKEYGASTGQLLDVAGSPQAGFHIRRLPTIAALCFEVLGINKIWPGNPVNRRYRCGDFRFNEASMVEQPAGAFLMIRRDAWEKIGGFDERFFPVWFEDVDCCKRLIENGFRIRYEPHGKAVHRGGHSASQLTLSSRETYWYGSLLKYVRKHFPRRYLPVVCVSVVGGALLRLLAGILRHQDFKTVFVYGKVIRLACRDLISRDSRVA